MRLLVTSAIIAVSVLSGCATVHDTDNKIAEITATINTLDARESSNNQAIVAKEAADVAALKQADVPILARANAAYKLAESRFKYTAVSTDESITFAAGKAVLSQDQEAKLTALAQQLNADNKDVQVEIQGHTDSRGNASHKNALGSRRAEAVRLFLSQQGVALNRMATISYADSRPADTGKTKEAYAANRRVAIIIVK
jgi:outer membrane protein OmpA-like peptidoglycan-associated protein